METWAKTCGPIPGGLILTHAHFCSTQSLWNMGVAQNLRARANRSWSLFPFTGPRGHFGYMLSHSHSRRPCAGTSTRPCGVPSECSMTGRPASMPTTTRRQRFGDATDFPRKQKHPAMGLFKSRSHQRHVFFFFVFLFSFSSPSVFKRRNHQPQVIGGHDSQPNFDVHLFGPLINIHRFIVT